MKLTEMDIPKLPDFINLTEAAERLGMTRQWANKMAQDGMFKSIRRVGNQNLFVVSEEEVRELVGQRYPALRAS
jgi:predicted DNA-binding transcriptional regulator AlpA